MNETIVVNGKEAARNELLKNIEQIKLGYNRGHLKLVDIQLLIALAEGYLKGEPRAHE